MTQLLSLAQLRSLPKVDLHRHLDCSWRWSTIVETAKNLGMTLPNDEALRRELFLTTQPEVDLAKVLKRFEGLQCLFQSSEILTRLAYEACEDAYNEGVLVLELRYAPTFISSKSPLSFQDIHSAFCRGIELAQKKWPMVVGLIGTIQRILPVADAHRVMDFMIENKQTFIGVDLADSELGFEPLLFKEVFAKAQKVGLPITIHSGEIPHPDAPKWVKQAIEVLGAQRIGHGIQIIQQPEIIDFVRHHQVVLEVCPWSNFLTQAFPTHEAHPLKKLWDQEVLCTLNSDDPGVFASALVDDYDLAQRYHGFNQKTFGIANQVARKASFLPAEKIAAVWPAESTFEK